MGKFLLLSDIHLLWDNPIGRLDNAHEAQLRKLKFVLDWAEENEATILQAGDFFDRPRSWYLLPEIMGLVGKYKVDWFMIFGQHDVYLYSQETRSATSLGILEKAGLVHILDESPIRIADDRGLIKLYGVSYGQSVPKVQDDSSLNILVIHAPIAEKALWPGHDYMDATKFLNEHKDFDIILCGDIHRKFLIKEEGRVICNTGCMIRKSVDLWDHRPCFFVYNTGKRFQIEEIEILHEPSEIVLSREHIDKSERIDAMLDKFVQSVGEEFEADVDFVSSLWKFVSENKVNQEVINVLSEVMGKEGR